MAKTPDVVNNFQAELVAKLSEAAEAEVEKLKAMKKRDVESRGESFDGQYFLWAHAFYSRFMLGERIRPGSTATGRLFSPPINCRIYAGKHPASFWLSFR